MRTMEPTAPADIHTARPAVLDIYVQEIEGLVAALHDRLNRAAEVITRSEAGVRYNAASLDAARDAIATTPALIDPWIVESSRLSQEYVRRGGWTRYWLVDSHDGHVHTSTACSTCRPTTAYYWLATESGKTADEVVALAGEKACTVCFPDAPVATRASRSHYSTPSQLAREDAAAKKTAKVAAKRAAQITTRDGFPLFEVGDTLQGGWSETTYQIKTERAASNAALEAAFDLSWYGVGHPSAPAWTETLRRCVDALAARRGVDAAEVRREIEGKTAKKFGRESR